MSYVGKPVVAVDIDEVLAYFIPTLADFHNDNYGGTLLTADSFLSYEFHKVWGGTSIECSNKMDLFYRSEYFNEKISPIPHALDTLLHLKNDYELHVVTARQHKIEEATKKWINCHYPDIFTKIHFGNHFSTEGKSRSKAEMCTDIGACLLIDDSLVYALQCHKENIPVLLFGHYAWNKNDSDAAKLVDDLAIENFLHADLHLNEVRDNEISNTIYRVTDWRKMKDAIHFILSYADNKTKVSKISVEPMTNEAIDSNKLVVAAIQMCSTNNKLANLQCTYRLVKQAVHQRQDVQFICLPECSCFIGNNAEELLTAAENISLLKKHSDSRCKVDFLHLLENYNSESTCPSADNFNYVDGLCHIASQFKVWLSVGGFPERQTNSPTSEEPGDVLPVANTIITNVDDHDNVRKIFNSHFLISPEGSIQSPIYHKIHLFDSPLAGLQESKTTIPGKEIVCTTIGVGQPQQQEWNVGLSVCYDLRFPGLYQSLRAGSSHSSNSIKCNSNGSRNDDDQQSANRLCSERPPADIILVPAAFTVKTGSAGHWEMLLRSRAIETQCYVIAAAQAGHHPNTKRSSYGHSLIIDPWGAIVAQLGEEDEGICIAELDKQFLNTIRRNMPVQNHARSDLY